MLIAHLSRLWGAKWPLPGVIPLLYVVLVAAMGDLRPEHVLLVSLAIGLAYFSERTKAFYVAALPYLVTAVGYDAVRYPRAWLIRPEGVLGCQLRSAELSLFAAGPGITWQDWFLVHHNPAVDLICAAPYFAFVYVVFGYSIYLYWVDRERMQRFLWTYAIGNLIAFCFWLFLPAAPPWYLQDHGCMIDLSAAPSPAALLRVDGLLGMHYFESFYSRSSSVFGALPSMHCSFPLMGLLVSWKKATWRTRPLHLGYTILMAFSAVYLRHHWIIDVLAGWGVATVSAVIAKQILARLAHPVPGLTDVVGASGEVTLAGPEGPLEGS